MIIFINAYSQIINEAECGFSEIFLFTNKGFFRCDSSTAGINPECEE